MSDTSSFERAARSGRSASASAPRSLASQQRLAHAEDRSWNGDDFHHRALVSQYRFPNSVGDAQRPFHQSGSDTSSMAMTAQSRSSTGSSSYTLYPQSGHSTYNTSTPRTPSLVSGPSASSTSSARTSNASYFLNPHQLEDEDDGPDLNVPAPRRRLACTFSFLNCRETFDDLQPWFLHCQSHFRDRSLPTTLDCPFSYCKRDISERTGAEAWRRWEQHIVRSHSGQDVVDTSRRPGRALIDHLWRVRIISDAEMKDLRRNGQLTDNSPFLRTAGSRQRRRGEM